jgi:lipid A 4'-phosphatase
VGTVLLLSVVIRSFELDQMTARWFWSSDTGWRLKHAPSVMFLHRHGTLPAIVIGSAGFVLWILSFIRTYARPARTFGLFLALALIAGPGLLVNALLKDHFGRPQPRDVIQFGGRTEFREIGTLPFVGHGKSFPSGHASTGFSWFAPAVYLWQRSRKLACLGTAIALIHGGLMSFARLAEGAHWLSDTVWAAACVHIAAWFVWRLLSCGLHPLVSPRAPGNTGSGLNVLRPADAGSWR